MKKRPSFYLDEKQINNLYKHVRKKMKRADRLKRVRKFLKDLAPLLISVLVCIVMVAVFVATGVKSSEGEAISAVFAIALYLIISIIKA